MFKFEIFINDDPILIKEAGIMVDNYTTVKTAIITKDETKFEFTSAIPAVTPDTFKLIKEKQKVNILKFVSSCFEEWLALCFQKN